VLLLNHREDLHYYMELIDIGKKLRGSVCLGWFLKRLLVRPLQAVGFIS
jgi:hypothetical protein